MSVIKFEKTKQVQLFTSPQSQPVRKLRRIAYLDQHHRSLYGRARRKNTGKELDSEAGLYYYGARYLDPRVSRWLSGDPALGEYVPVAPVSDEARKRNGNLPGMGGVFNYVNLHVYHYAGNSPVKLVDPDGRDFYNFTQDDITIRTEKGKYVNVPSGKMYNGRIDGAILADDTVIKISGGSIGPVIDVSVETIDDQDNAFLLGLPSINANDTGDLIKFIENIFIEDDKLYSGVYSSEVALNHPDLQKWISAARDSNTVEMNNPMVRDITIVDSEHVSAVYKEQLRDQN